MSSLVSGEWLEANAADPKLCIIDLRWYLDDPSRGRRAYGEGHIPHARFVDLDQITGPLVAGGAGGRHPLPGPAQLTEVMRAVGVNQSSHVVVYDDAGGSVAGRLWWLLRAHGHEGVSVLDGGLPAWPGVLATEVPTVTPGDFLAHAPDSAGIVDAAAVASLGTATVLLDARAPERYRGEVEPVDPAAGHIPGAVHAFWKDNLDGAGRFLAPADLERRFRELGVEPGGAVVYCGSGVTACHDLLAIERAGLGPVRLYAGSWSDWCSRPSAPVAVGPAPGGRS